MTSFDYQAAAQERNRLRRKLRDAAPDLLAALEAAAEQLRTLLDESLEEDYSVLTSAETAIAKAKGADA